MMELVSSFIKLGCFMAGGLVIFELHRRIELLNYQIAELQDRILKLEEKND